MRRAPGLALPDADYAMGHPVRGHPIAQLATTVIYLDSIISHPLVTSRGDSVTQLMSYFYQCYNPLELHANHIVSSHQLLNLKEICTGVMPLL